jgi:hypothetical protein
MAPALLSFEAEKIEGRGDIKIAERQEIICVLRCLLMVRSLLSFLKIQPGFNSQLSYNLGSTVYSGARYCLAYHILTASPRLL